MNKITSFSFLDRVILSFDNALKIAANNPPLAKRLIPSAGLPEVALTEEQRTHAARLMRINHVGEVCAQALYQGQALTAHSPHIQAQLAHAAEEEQDHLAWCQQRINELGGRTSYLNSFWYSASFLLGVIAGLAGDPISLGFLAETEKQVEQHLTEHLQKLAPEDSPSRSILEQMRHDEAQHALTAEDAGATALPTAVKTLMQCFANVMKTTAYWI